MSHCRGTVARTPLPQVRRRWACAVVAFALAGPLHAQGVYPGPLAAEGDKLPGGFEPVLHLRTYYFDQESVAGVPSEAWALGGWAGARSPWWGELLQVGLVGYTSQKLYGPEDKGGTRLLTPTQGSITVLGEAYAALRVADQTFTAYRQLINRPFINPNDSRMVPHTFEAYTLGGAAGALSYTGGYITKVKVRDTDEFRWMSEVAGAGSGDHQGVVYAGLTYRLGKSGYVRLDEQYTPDVFNSFYADIRYPLDLGGGSELVLGAQAYPQSSVGAERIGSFSSWGYGLQAAYGRGPFELQLIWTQTGKERDTLNPYGTHPSYLNMMQVAFNTAGERAWGLGGSIEFDTLGAPGLSASVLHASGSDRRDFATGAPLADRHETDVQADYRFPKGSVFEGLRATLRYAWLHQDGAAQTGTQLRAYLNYDVRF
jgi:hypothetical protein